METQGVTLVNAFAIFLIVLFTQSLEMVKVMLIRERGLKEYVSEPDHKPLICLRQC